MPDFNTRYLELEERVCAAIAAAEPSLFDALALEAFAFQREFNPALDRYCRERGVAGTPRDWREIPAVPQAAFKVSAMRCFPAGKSVAAFHTSGTTGEGHGVHEFYSLRLYDEAILRGWDRLRVPPLPQRLLIPNPAAAPHSSLSYMMGCLGARSPEQSWCVNADGSLADLPDAGEEPVLLLGTALALLHRCEEGPAIALPPGSIVFETGGYKGSGRSLAKEELYRLIEERLGVPPDSVINEYGMTELSSQCYTRGLGRAHEAPPWMRVLAVDPATGEEVRPGETGVLRIYDLANLGSAIGIQTRDLAVRRETGFELLGRDPTAIPRGCSRSADEMLLNSRR